MSKAIVIGMAEMKAARGGDVLTTLGLGSCVGITLYDPVSKIGGMAHVMLPDSSSYRSDKNLNRAKFADIAIYDLIEMMQRMGANKLKLVAKMAGGAHMFTRTTHDDIMKVGERNALMAKEVLSQLRIPVLAQDTGGTYGRTIELRTADGSLWIKTIGKGERTL